MKINPGDPAYPLEEKYLEAGIQCREQHYGIPIRLEIAARIMAAMSPDAKTPGRETAEWALVYADAIIAAYNASELA